MKLKINRLAMQLLTGSVFALFTATLANATPYTYTFSFGGASTEITPLSGNETAKEYYDYWSWSGHPDFGTEESTAFFWLWEDTAGNISMNAIFSTKDKNLTGSGKAHFTLSGLPFGSSWDLKDDSEWSIVNKPTWKWNSKNTDGGIIGSLADAEWNINWFADKLNGVDNWYVLSGDSGKYANGFALEEGTGFSISSTAPVPEPATMLLFGTGLVGLAVSIRRKKK